MKSRSDLVPCERCGHSARIRPALRAMAPDEARRLTLKRHQKGGKCQVETFARAMREQDFVRAGDGWRMLDLIEELPRRSGPVAYVPRSTETDPHDTDAADATLTMGRWIPRWAKLVWDLHPTTREAVGFVRSLLDASEEERAALLSAHDMGGRGAARLLLWELMVRKKG